MQEFSPFCQNPATIDLEEVDFTHPALWHTDCTYLAGYEGWL
jgi:hypothetical protein